MALDVWLVAVLVVVCAWLARWIRAWSLGRHWRRPLPQVPEELATLWARADPRESDQGEPPEQASCSGVDVLFHLSRLDRQQLQRFSPDTLPQNFGELLTQLGQDTAPATPSSARAHERWLALELSHEGHDVVVSETLEPGLVGRRAWVDGSEVRLIATLDREVLTQLLQREPELTLVTYGDHAAAFATEARVVALASVTAEQTNSEPRQSHQEPVPQSLAALSAVSSLLPQHAMSSTLRLALQSAELMAKGDSSWLSSAAHGLADNAASSVGGWAGARAGAMMGALLGPVGAAAGGLLGGLLGKQWGAGIASSTRERKLKRLLEQHSELLAKVPRLACESLEAQAGHLDGVRDSLLASNSFELWPRVGSVARREVAVEYGRWQHRLRVSSRRLRSWLDKRPSAAKLTARGEQLLARGGLGWSVPLLQLVSELQELSHQIERERERAQR